jgi:hypothetical protein
LESELAAKEQSQKGFEQLPPECTVLLDFIEQQIGVPLAAPVPKDWKGFLFYRRHQQSTIICRGRVFKEGVFGKHRAGLDVAYGQDTINDHLRAFDVSPPQDLDHLLINFGGEAKSPRVFLWYGENIAPYKLIFMAEVESDPHKELSDAVVEACTWILQRPKDQTLPQFLEKLSGSA